MKMVFKIGLFFVFVVNCAEYQSLEKNDEHCGNGIKDNNETDVDCGGPNCEKCLDGRSCVFDHDCVSGFCNENGICESECVELECSDMMYECGSWEDGCGGRIDCGSCLSGEICNDSGRCVSCESKTCEELGYECGIWNDGCGFDIDCGQCGWNEYCNANGICTSDCEPTSCAENSYECGLWEDGCGGELDCGECEAGEVCSDLGRCEPACVPSTCAGLGYECGTWDDGCGDEIDCGSCENQEGEYCTEDGICVNDCIGLECGLSPNLGFDCGTCSNIFENCEYGECVFDLSRWQNPSSEERMDWYEATQYCNDLVLDGYSDWRLPTIGELRYLIEGCEGSEAPDGACRVTDECVDHSLCSDEGCWGCEDEQGPNDGCYWKDELMGYCETYLSSTTQANCLDCVWVVHFYDAAIAGMLKTVTLCVRCIRDI